MIQQFREAPSAYIFFVHDLIQNLVEFRECGIILDRIFQKLKDHFCPAMEMTEDGEVPTKNKCKLEVNIEIEHMALFYHDILKDSAISKIMKSASRVWMRISQRCRNIEFLSMCLTCTESRTFTAKLVLKMH